ncbi:MAG: phage tail tape measure C-terminal domain-containing protein [Paracoccus sp. (in: a-proteobacteria)]|uniref:Phage tail tape measure C-terminal domain-containing protein n=1 Tax=Paracoccus spongiarum TaxID=3064387 RepID=A0ABT9JFR4_9RHOB|nr:phage tail tape measure C-terminal domain-containing protein [Paracoccus sp. 2205BS29-5]MDP5308652.1 phage tail tape measure C-terminal domain-containing protein [Paracoccus sp. 2205BS29-5]
MAEKRVSVRLAAVGGRQVRAELEGVGEAGSRGFGRLSREMEAANARMAGFTRKVGVAAAAAVAAATAAGIAMVRSGLQTVDAQAKLAQSLGTTVASIQTLERAGELAGVSMSGIEQATKDLTRRLSQAAAGGGPAADALERLGLTAGELLELPLDQRVGAINAAIADFVPVAQRAAVAGQLFGEEGSIAMSRIDTATLRQATEDVRAFGVVVSEQDADRIERTNDAISRLGLVWRGLSNQLAVAAAPALEAVADAMAALASRTGPLGMAISGLFDQIGRLSTYAASFAAFMAGRWVAGLAAAALSVRGLATALVVLRGALIRTGIGALIVGAGELVYQFTRLVRGAGGFGNAMALMGDVAKAVWEGIKTTAMSFADDFRAMQSEIEAIWTRLMAFLAGKWSDFLGMIAPTFNKVAEEIGSDTRIDVFEALGRASMLDHAASNSAHMAGRYRDRASSSRASAFDGVRPAMEALRAAMSGGEDDAGGAALDVATEAAGSYEDALGGVETAATGAGAAAKEAGAAGKAAADEAKPATEATATDWKAVTEALSDYAKKAKEIGADIGQALVGAFQSAENAVGEFVKTGKLDFRDLVTSLLADLSKLAARRFLLGPIANALSGALGGAGGIFASIMHTGGMVGATGPGRTVPALAFAGAPRMHSGGMVGLRHDEVPAILQRGERVLSRREAQDYGNAVTVNINARDAESFRQSRTQIAADIARAVSLGRRGL